jgi:hypothetical protein
MAIVLSLLAFGFMSVLLFGGPLQAIAFLSIWSDRLGMAYWPALLLISIALAAFQTKYLLQSGLQRVFLPATFVVTAMLSSATLVGACAVMERNRIIEDFEPDLEIRSSIFASFRYLRQDFNFFLHGAALKDCKPYAWSYSKMAFYELPSNVAVNVLPKSWIEQCSIERTR